MGEAPPIPTTTMKKPKVLVLGSPLEYVDSEYYEDFIREYDVQVLDAKDRAETIAKLGKKIEVDGPFEALVCKMGTIPYEPYDGELLGPLSGACKIIVSASAGYNEFDVDWMTSRGIWFCNTLSAVSEATADMTLYFILATVRNTSLAEKQARQGDWKKGLTPSDDTHGKVLGIVGMGAIGKFVAEKARVFGMKVAYHNRHRLPVGEEERYGVRFCETLEELLRTADILSVHTPLNASTKDLISAPQFEMMKDGSYLVNTARGAIVNPKALIAALESGKLRRAGLDVFEDEPKIDSWFMRSDKAVLQPHMGGLTVSAFAKSERECLENVRALFERDVPNSPVNKPESKR